MQLNMLIIGDEMCLNTTTNYFYLNYLQNKEKHSISQLPTLIDFPDFHFDSWKILKKNGIKVEYKSVYYFASC